MTKTTAQANGSNAITERDPRFQIAAARRILYREGADSQVGGHVSLRVKGDDAFFITPYQYFDETLPEDIVKVGFDLAVREPGAHPASPGINFHSDIYRARPDVNCIIHTHGRNAGLLSTVAEAPQPFHIYASLFFDDTAFFRDDPHQTADQEGEAMAAALGGKRAMLLSHHGALHVGDNLKDVTAEAILFETVAGRHLEALAVGGRPLDGDTARAYRHLYLRIDFRAQIWDANYRRLRRSDPDLFERLAPGAGS